MQVADFRFCNLPLQLPWRQKRPHLATRSKTTSSALLFQTVNAFQVFHHLSQLRGCSGTKQRIADPLKYHRAEPAWNGLCQRSSILPASRKFSQLLEILVTVRLLQTRTQPPPLERTAKWHGIQYEEKLPQKRTTTSISLLAYRLLRNRVTAFQQNRSTYSLKWRSVEAVSRILSGIGRDVQYPRYWIYPQLQIDRSSQLRLE